jgi:soluble lytic murein transglycosylase-like protein
MRFITVISLLLFLAPTTVIASGSGKIYMCQRKDDSIVFVNSGAMAKFRAKNPRAKCKEYANFGPSNSTPSSPGTRSSTKRRKPRKSRPYQPPKGDGARPLSATAKSRLNHRILQYVREASERYNLPEEFILGVMYVESRFKVRAKSHAGAMGLMQLMPGTAEGMGVSDPWDPYQNIMGGSRFLRRLADRFDGDFVKVISGYHAGGGAVNREGGIPHRQTAEYVRAVLDAYYGFTDGIMSIDSAKEAQD